MSENAWIIWATYKGKNLPVLVDEQDYAILSRFNWQARMDGTTYYAQRNTYDAEGKRTKTQMHKEDCFGWPQGGIIHHFNGNGWDNRRQNMTWLPGRHAHSMFEQKRDGVSSRYKGVSWYSRIGRWQAFHLIDGKNVHLGYFDDEVAAAKAYDAAVIEYRGDEAVTNDSLELYEV